MVEMCYVTLEWPLCEVEVKFHDEGGGGLTEI